MRTSFVKWFVLAGIAVVLGGVLLGVNRSVAHNGQDHATRNLHRVFSTETSTLMTLVEAVYGGNRLEKRQECHWENKTWTKTEAYCVDNVIFSFRLNAPLLESQQVVINAEKLDAKLDERGWQADRPQDEVSSNKKAARAAHANSHTPQDLYQIGYHKNHGAISCNLRVEYWSAGVQTSTMKVDIAEFSCQQRVTYPSFNLHRAHRVVL